MYKIKHPIHFFQVQIKVGLQCVYTFTSLMFQTWCSVALLWFLQMPGQPVNRKRKESQSNVTTCTIDNGIQEVTRPWRSTWDTAMLFNQYFSKERLLWCFKYFFSKSGPWTTLLTRATMIMQSMEEDAFTMHSLKSEGL